MIRVRAHKRKANGKRIKVRSHNRRIKRRRNYSAKPMSKKKAAKTLEENKKELEAQLESPEGLANFIDQGLKKFGQNKIMTESRRETEKRINKGLVNLAANRMLKLDWEKNEIVVPRKLTPEEVKADKEESLKKEKKVKKEIAKANEKLQNPEKLVEKFKSKNKVPDVISGEEEIEERDKAAKKASKFGDLLTLEVKAAVRDKEEGEEAKEEKRKETSKADRKRWKKLGVDNQAEEDALKKANNEMRAYGKIHKARQRQLEKFLGDYEQPKGKARAKLANEKKLGKLVHDYRMSFINAGKFIKEDDRAAFKEVKRKLATLFPPKSAAFNNLDKENTRVLRETITRAADRLKDVDESIVDSKVKAQELGEKRNKLTTKEKRELRDDPDIFQTAAESVEKQVVPPPPLSPEEKQAVDQRTAEQQKRGEVERLRGQFDRATKNFDQEAFDQETEIREIQAELQRRAEAEAKKRAEQQSRKAVRKLRKQFNLLRKD
jgi:hypothetical protein